MPPKDVFLGVFSKASDPSSGGRQMPNHWSEPDLNVFTHSSVIATQFPHAENDQWDALAIRRAHATETGLQGRLGQSRRGIEHAVGEVR